MIIRVYNDNGRIKITEEAGRGGERVMFGSLADGEVAEIRVEVANLSVESRKRDYRVVQESTPQSH